MARISNRQWDGSGWSIGEKGVIKKNQYQGQDQLGWELGATLINTVGLDAGRAKNISKNIGGRRE
jgi:hypothetical protein